MPFKPQEKVSVLQCGGLVEGIIIATAKDDAGNYAYQVEAPNDALGAPSKWVKASEVFVVEPSSEEKQQQDIEKANALLALNRSLG